MKLNKLKVGLIGLGKIAEVHLKAYQQVSLIDVIAGADINSGRMKTMTKHWNLKGYTDYQKMLEKEELDIVCILTPARYHWNVVKDSAENGVNILCEKPIATNIEDAKSIINVCEKRNVKFYYGSTYRWLAACRKAKELIDQDLLGNISILLEAFIGGSGRESYKDLGNSHYPNGTPGGGGMGLMDHGIHLIDIFYWMLNSEIEHVVGRINISGSPPFTEFLTMMFKNGAIGQLIYNETSFSSDLPYEGIFSWGGSWDIEGKLSLEGSWQDHPGNIRIHGDKGAFRVYYYANKLFYFSNGQKQPIKVLDRPMPDNFALQMESFVNSIQNDLKPEVTAKDGLRALATALAANESFQTKKFVRVEY